MHLLSQIREGKKLFFFFVLVALVASSVFTTRFVNAAEGRGMGSAISPPVTELTVSPGEAVTRTLVVENKGSDSVFYKMTVNNLVASGEDGSSAFQPRGDGGLADWTTLSPSEFSLGAGESAEVRVTLSAPKNAPPGGHAATVFASASALGSLQGTGSRIGTIVGANFLVNVSGNVIEKAAVAEFSTERAKLNVGDPLAFTVRVQNSGNTNLKPTGVVEIFRKNTKVTEIAVNAEGGSVLPGSVRKFMVNSDKTLGSGQYTARLALRYGSGQILVAPDLTFSVVSDSQLLIVAVILLALLVGALLTALMFSRKKIKIS